MQRLATRTCAVAIGLGVIAFAAIHAAPEATGQTGPGWVALFDGKTIGRNGTRSARPTGGRGRCDRRRQTSGQDAAHLVSKAKYKDFQIHVEFWASDDANSGIFLRCQDPTKITDRTCYEVNIFDQRKDPTYGTGGIVNFAEVNPMPKAGGKWNTFEITAKGRQITVVLNGQKTAELHNGLFAEGPITLQHGAASSSSARSRSSRCSGKDAEAWVLRASARASARCRGRPPPLAPARRISGVAASL